jgi:hypothetical protein
MLSEIFLQKGLDRGVANQPDGQITLSLPDRSAFGGARCERETGGKESGEAQELYNP